MLKTENYFLQLKTLDEIKKVNVEMQFDEDQEIDKFSMFIDGEKIEITDHNTESIFIKLSKLLDGKYEIHSCYTCKYGNFCPVGDQDNEIFCVSDFEPKCKADLYFVTEDGEERKKRSRTLFDLCANFQPSSEDYYTYK